MAGAQAAPQSASPVRPAMGEGAISTSLFLRRRDSSTASRSAGAALPSEREKEARFCQPMESDLLLAFSRHDPKGDLSEESPSGSEEERAGDGGERGARISAFPVLRRERNLTKVLEAY